MSARNLLTRYRLMPKLRVLALTTVIIMLVTPLRNLLMPAFLWNGSWNDLHSLKLLRIHLFDLFYYIDRTPYTGSCEEVRKGLGVLTEIKYDALPVYTAEDFDKSLHKIRWRFNAEELWKIEHFKPSLTAEEQREMLYGLLVLAKAFDTFNVTYFVAEGTLLGLHRHHGMIPWDDDVDLMIQADQWAKAKEVLSCIPDFTLDMGRDYMWKFMWNRSKLWRYETVIRFPYIDVFPYNEDAEHLWPLTIWMKRDLIWRSEYTYPAQRLPLEGHSVVAPRDPAGVLAPHYGPDTLSVCASRIFKRREREPFPESERVRIPCSFLHDIYPFVFHQADLAHGTSFQVRKIGSTILSTFKPG